MFGARMVVEIENDGPVTILLESLRGFTEGAARAPRLPDRHIRHERPGGGHGAAILEAPPHDPARRKWALCARFCVRGDSQRRRRRTRYRDTVTTMQIHDRERELQSEIEELVGAGAPDVEVLAVELLAAERFCVYIDHSDGVDHALCERVTDLLRGYLDRYTVDVSSPGLERPLRKPDHFEAAVGTRVAVRTAHELDGRRRFRGELVAAARRDGVPAARRGHPGDPVRGASCGPT